MTDRKTGPSQPLPAGESAKPFAVEYYYKTKWGHAEEFISLFRKNHLPILRKQVELGRFLEVTAHTPRYHATEDGRWDYRITIVFASAAAAMEGSPSEKTLAAQMFPDQETFRREEQRRFQILEAHWDLPIKTVELESR